MQWAKEDGIIIKGPLINDVCHFLKNWKNACENGGGVKRFMFGNIFFDRNGKGLRLSVAVFEMNRMIDKISL